MAKKLFVSPKGAAVFPHVTAADFKFKKEGEFHTKVRVSQDDAAEYAKAQSLVKAIDACAQKTLAEEKTKFAALLSETTDKKKLKELKDKAPELCDDMPYKIDDESGEITFNFKMKASGEDKKTKEKWTRKLPLFDAKGNPITRAIKVGGNSIIKVSHQEPDGYFANAKIGVTVSLRMEGVQIIELREYTKDAGAYGFGKEDGYSDADTDGTPAGDETREATDDEAAEASSSDVSADDF